MKLWRQALLGGYHQEEPSDDRLFDLYVTFAVIEKWIRDESILEKKSWRSRFTQFALRKHFMKLISRILTSIFVSFNLCGETAAQLF